MKNTLKKILFVLILLVCGQLYAQTNQNWAPIGAKWYYSSLHKRDLGFWPSYTVIESIRQQLFQGKMCRVLQQKVYYKNGNSAVEGEYYTYEDSNKVYYWANNQFYKLYDFVSPVGTEWDVYGIEGDNFCDLIPGSPPPPPVATRQLGRIKKTKDTTIMVNNLPLKMFKSDTVTGYKRFALERETIQRIGNTKFMFPHQVNFCRITCCFFSTTMPFYSLRCYSDSLINYRFSFPLACDTFLYTNIPKYPNFEVSIYPNPFGEELTFLFDNLPANGEDLTVSVYSMLGVEMLHKTIKIQTRTQTFGLDTQDLRPGAYYAVVKNSQQTLRYTKMIKL